MKNKSGIINLLPLFLIGVVILVTVGGAYYVSQDKDTQVTSEISSQEPIAEEIDMSDWLTYKNSANGITFKYPNTWKLTTLVDEQDALSLVLLPENIDSYVPPNTGVISITNLLQAVSDWDLYIKGHQCPTANSCIVDSKEEIIINSYPFLRVMMKSPLVEKTIFTIARRETNNADIPYFYTEIRLKTNDLVFSEVISEEERLKVYNQILSTFEFTK